jgi:uncharacterized protein (DUF2236 family)
MSVGEAELERQLDIVRRRAAGALPGVFGPDSQMWQIHCESAVFVGAGRAVLLQLAHPWVAAAIAEHSRTLGDPIGRFHRTFSVVFTMIFGSLDQALEASRRLHRLHESITGILPGAAGPFAAGSSYRANEIEALKWVHATLIDTSVLVYERLLGPLAPKQREQYYEETKLFAALFGIPEEALSPDWNSFVAYNRTMWESTTLTVIPAARRIASQLMESPSSGGVRLPEWYRALTALLCPPPIRQGFGGSFGEREKRQAETALRWITRLYPALPSHLRHVGPYLEAEARLSGRRQPGLLTQSLNRLWIGHPLMPR